MQKAVDKEEGEEEEEKKRCATYRNKSGLVRELKSI